METSTRSMESHHFDGALISIIRSNSSGSAGRSSPAPALIPSTSLQSFSESDTDSLSSSPHPALSPSTRVGGRSIFDKYWTSPTHKKRLEKDDTEEEEAVLKRLSTLQLPLADEEEDDSDQKTCAIIHPATTTTASPKTDKISPSTTTDRERKTSFDDTSIKYSTPTRPRTQRRQILPTPPPPSLSSSLTIPRSRPQAQMLLSPRGWSSTSALLKRPSQSCLRKSRYSSFSGVVPAENGADINQDELKKENTTRVSFYSQVSVFEYHEQIQRSQKGWSKYFA